MAEKDYVGSPVTIKKTLVFNQKDLYKYLKKSFKNHGYSINETDYDESLTEDGSKTVSFYWECSKKASGYVALIINMNFESTYKDVNVKKDNKELKAQKGNVVLEFRSLINKDPKGDWELNEQKPFGAFFRELYDKLVKKEHFDDINKTVESDFKAIISETKLFLKMLRYD